MLSSSPRRTRFTSQGQCVLTQCPWAVERIPVRRHPWRRTGIVSITISNIFEKDWGVWAPITASPQYVGAQTSIQLFSELAGELGK